MTQATEVLFPSSVDEAVDQFGDGAGVTVVAGGTIVVPEITYGRLTPGRALMLGGAGLDTIDDDGTTVTVGAGVRVSRLTELADAVPALAQCALNVADVEIRATDAACRLGGDEFAVILPGSSAEDAIKVAERAQETLAEIGHGQFSFSGGIARVTPANSSAEMVYRSADLAAYRAKAAGGARTLLAVETRAAAAG